jgi:hypothetical protein
MNPVSLDTSRGSVLVTHCHQEPIRAQLHEAGISLVRVHGLHGARIGRPPRRLGKLRKYTCDGFVTFSVLFCREIGGRVCLVRMGGAEGLCEARLERVFVCITPMPSYGFLQHLCALRCIGAWTALQNVFELWSRRLALVVCTAPVRLVFFISNSQIRCFSGCTVHVAWTSARNTRSNIGKTPPGVRSFQPSLRLPTPLHPTHRRQTPPPLKP